MAWLRLQDLPKLDASISQVAFFLLNHLRAGDGVEEERLISLRKKGATGNGS